ncbi:basic leucine zipper transcriptional factor ATF-like 3 isoform X1 [Oryzias latipes]
MSESLQSVQEMMVKEQFCEGWQVQQCTLDEGRRLKRREKNRVAAQRSRKRQMQRADLLHEVCERRACELLEQRNKSLKREVESLSEEQHFLTEALRAHEPFCPSILCSFNSASLQPDNMAARSL